MSVQGLNVLDSVDGFEPTVARLETFLRERNVAVLARIDHAAGARSVGLDLPPTTVFVFGDPHAGTPLMRVSKTVAIDLPLKMLVAERKGGRASISYVDPAWIAAWHGGFIGQDEVLTRMEILLAEMALAATARTQT